MTTRSKFVFQTASPVRKQNVQNVVLVPQNPLEQIVVHIFNEFSYCHDIGTAPSWAHTPVDDCLRSLPISRCSKTPPGIGCVRKFGNDNTSENCLCVFLAHAVCKQCSYCLHRLRAWANNILTWSLTDSLSDMVTPSIFIVVTRVMPESSGGGVNCRLCLVVKTISSDLLRFNV